MKKNLLLISVLASVGVVVSSICLAHSRTFIDVVLGDGDNHNHTVSFNGSNISSIGAYDSENWIKPFHLYKTNAIRVSDSEKYDLETNDFDSNDWSGTYYYGEENKVTFGQDGNIAVVASQGHEAFNFAFLIDNRATVDLNKSVVVYNDVDGDPENATAVKFEYDEGNSTLTKDYYYCYFGFNSLHGHTVAVQSISFVFSC